MAKLNKGEREAIVSKMEKKAEETLKLMRETAKARYSNTANINRVKALKKELDKINKQREVVYEKLEKLVGAGAKTKGFRGGFYPVYHSMDFFVKSEESVILETLKKNTITASLPIFDFSEVQEDLVLAGIGGDFNVEEFTNNINSYIKE